MDVKPIVDGLRSGSLCYCSEIESQQWNHFGGLDVMILTYGLALYCVQVSSPKFFKLSSSFDIRASPI